MLSATVDGLVVAHPEPRRAVCVFATTAPVQQNGYLGPVSLDLNGCDLSLLNTGRAPLLADHERHLGALVGMVEGAWITPGRALALIRFAHTPRGEDAYSMLQEGMLPNCSAGFTMPKDLARDDAGIYLCPRWRPYEISLTPVPADWHCSFLPPGLGDAEREAWSAAEMELAARQSRQATVLRHGAILGAFAGQAATGLAARLGLPAELVAAALVAEVDAYQAGAEGRAPPC